MEREREQTHTISKAGRLARVMQRRFAHRDKLRTPITSAAFYMKHRREWV